MHFSLAIIISVIPYLVSATPVAEHPRITIPLSKKSSMYKPDGSLNPESLRAQLAASTAEMARGYQAYERNPGHRHPKQPDAIIKLAMSGEPLTDESDTYWKGPITAGTTPVTYFMDFDTGSSDTFLPSSDCEEADCTGHTKYNASASSTSKSLGIPFELGFGDHSNVKGIEYQNTVRVAGLKATSQVIGVGPGHEPGLCFQTSHRGSELTLGGLNPDLYVGEPTYIPVTRQGYWQFQFAALKVGNTVAVGPTAAIVDSGSTLVIGSSAKVKAFYAAIPGSIDAATLDPRLGGFTAFPCSADIPQISFNIGGKDLPMEPSTFNLGNLTDDLCVGSIVINDEIGGLFVLGDAFMKNTRFTTGGILGSALLPLSRHSMSAGGLMS